MGLSFLGIGASAETLFVKYITSMRIGINTLAVNLEDFGGGVIYLYFLLKHLAKVDQQNEYFIFVSPKNKDKFTIGQKNFREVICQINTTSRVKRVLYEQSFLPRLLRKYKIDIFHGPNNVLPLRTPCKSVMTIQYMFSFIMPGDYTPFYRRWYFNTLMRLSVRKADKIISVSDDNKNQIIRYLGIKESKICIIYHGIDGSFSQEKNLKNVETYKAKFGINSEYILCVGNNVLNKNLDGLIKAFDYLKKQYSIPHNLVIVGNNGFSRKRQAWFHNVRSKHSNIIHTGYIDYKELPTLYSGASAFVLPSFCESFGIPLLEAMACGAPIVTSNTFAMPEVVGDAGLLVNPYDFQEIGDAIYSLLKDKELREVLIKKGLERVKIFSWEKAAKQTLAVYQEVYKN